MIIPLELFGDDVNFHHLGIAVESIAKVDPSLDITAEPLQGVAVSFVYLNGILVELIEPSGDASPVQQSIGNGIKLVHLCFAVKDLEKAMDTARSSGFFPIKKPVPSAYFGDKLIAWIYSSEFGLVELLEDPDGSQS